MNIGRENAAEKTLLFTAILATLIISPTFAYDPINLPKMLVISTGAFALIPFLIISIQTIRVVSPIAFTLSAFLIFTFLLSMLTNDRSFSQQFWGVWGRNTGFLTYFAFITAFLVSITLAYRSDFILVRLAFERLSYAISIYTLMQAGGIDPINWSQKQMVATLGNLNFMSSFLGLATISCASRLFHEKLSLTSKLHYLFFVTLNLYLMWISGSIQGIGVFAAGLSFVVAFKIMSKTSLRNSIIWLIFAAGVGSILFLGTMGLGPLSPLKQVTVIFRRDYWLAGWNMTLDNWLNGVGIDSYGDYYEQYRDLSAVTRTGPERVANTAHNIFLDVSSGSGLFAGLSFLAILVFVMIAILKTLKNSRMDNTFIAVSSMFMGFIVFCLISINQIGVGIWGFLFAGYVVGASSRLSSSTSESFKNSKSESQTGKKTPRFNSEWTLPAKLASLALGLIGFLIALPPNITDAQMLSAIKKGDLVSMRNVVTEISSTSQFTKKYMTLLLDKGLVAEAYEFAGEELKRDPRNDIALRVVAYNDKAPTEQRKAALLSLKQRDPQNLEFAKYLDELLAKLG